MNYIDMHCDTLMKAYLGFKKDIYQLKRPMVDVKRLREAGAEAQFFAIFLPPVSLTSLLGALMPSDDQYIEKLLHILLQTIKRHPRDLALARSFEELEQNRAAGKCSAIVTMEDGRSVDGKLEKLEGYYNMGIRLISLTWNAPNCFGWPNSQDPLVMSRGLTDFGKEAVARMNELGMLVDVSHLSDGGFWDVAQICQGPFVASHSNCRSLSPHTRNLTDEMIKALADHGGAAGINFGPAFLSADIHSKRSTLEDIVAHIRHFVKIGGEECVGIGTDFDGISGSFDIRGPQQMELLFHALQKSGFHENQIERFARGNVRRVLREVLK